MFRLAYFGSPFFSARLLEKILTDKDLPVEVVLVVTQPDKPVGRNQIITPSLVKQMAIKYNIPFKNSEFIIHNSELRDVDLSLLYAYGKIIPKEILQIPKYGFWNIHPSLLPRYRGPSPIAYPLILGDTETGVTLMQMSEKLDAGPIIAQQSYLLTGTETHSDLEITLTDMGYELFKKEIIKFAEHLKSGRTSEVGEISYTRRLTKQDGFIPLPILKKALNNEPLSNNEIPHIIQEYANQYPITNNQYQKSASLIFNLFRGFSPWPGIWTITPEQKRLKITSMSLTEGKLTIKKVQLEGKKEVDFPTFQSAYKVF